MQITMEPRVTIFYALNYLNQAINTCRVLHPNPSAVGPHSAIFFRDIISILTVRPSPTIFVRLIDNQHPLRGVVLDGCDY